MSTVTPLSEQRKTGANWEGRPRVTISDVAAALGLTKGTVSRALNGYTDISDTTRLRVARQAEAMGYQPLAQAQAIRTGRARALGLVLQISQHDAHAPFLTDFLAGVTSAASAENWTLAIATATSDAHMRETLQRMTAEQKADGFILPRTLTHDTRITYLRGAGVPFVLFGRTADTEGCGWYDILGEDAMRDAVVRLADLGHRRIGYVNGGAEFNFCHLRRAGFDAGLAAAGLEPDTDLVREDARRASDGAAAVRSLLALPRPPTAIVFATDEAALGAYLAAKGLGITIGSEVSIIAYDGIPEGAYATPALTTFAVDTRRAGERLAQLLIRRIRGTPPEDLRELVPAQLVTRGSDRPPALSSEDLARHLSDQAAPVRRATPKGGERT